MKSGERQLVRSIRHKITLYMCTAERGSAASTVSTHVPRLSCPAFVRQHHYIFYSTPILLSTHSICAVAALVHIQEQEYLHSRDQQHAHDPKCHCSELSTGNIISIPTRPIRAQARLRRTSRIACLALLLSASSLKTKEESDSDIENSQQTSRPSWQARRNQGRN
jgi:hypothetical protein